MTKTDKELAVDVAKTFIEARSLKIAIASNNVPHYTKATTLQEINSVIESVYQTLINLPDKK